MPARIPLPGIAAAQRDGQNPEKRIARPPTAAHQPRRETVPQSRAIIASMSITAADSLLAAAPPLLVLLLLVWRGWSGARAGLAGWLLALALALARFGAGAQLLFYAHIRAFILTVGCRLHHLGGAAALPAGGRSGRAGANCYRHRQPDRRRYPARAPAGLGIRLVLAGRGRFWRTGGRGGAAVGGPGPAADTRPGHPQHRPRLGGNFWLARLFVHRPAGG